MSTATMPRCSPLRCASRPGAPAARGARATAFALVLLALLLMLYGEAWLLQRSAEAPDELTVATCALEAVDPRPAVMAACTQSTTMNADKETL